MRSEFLLDPEVAFLNHGSFGACPRVVFEAYQSYQRELEREPVDFLQRTFKERMRSARAALADYLGCGQDEVTFVRNATYGLNLVARSVGLQAGDTVVSTDVEYGAVDRMWQTICDEAGARYVRAAIDLPVDEPGNVTEALRSHLDGTGKVLSVSHIAAEAGQIFPVDQLVALAKEVGVTSVVDGAHAPGQVELALGELGADFYVGNCHKWMCAPKGSAFVFADQSWAERIRPPVVGWGDISAGSSALLLENEWQGTSDISAFLAVADAIDFQRERNWFEEVVPRCAQLLDDATPALLEVTGQPNLYVHPDLRPPQLATFRLPPGDHPKLHSELFQRFQVEVPVFPTSRGTLMRVSAQAYNNAEDLERLVAALRELL